MCVFAVSQSSKAQAEKGVCRCVLPTSGTVILTEAGHFLSTRDIQECIRIIFA
eukprot:m.1654217 g.1654217  ORF g.1654217 m.1654217 type:complete len:53 (-) comp100884_c0_seq1:18-176(-)